MKILKYQLLHIVLLTILLISIYMYIIKTPSILQGSFLNVSTPIWLLLAIISPILHQAYVLICWRMELYYQCISNKFGIKGFKWYKIGFTVLILSRVLTIIMLAISNKQTLNISTFINFSLTLACLIPSAYLFYSVKKYFGIDRAFGIDHFNPEKFKNTPFIKKGIFKYTSNGMYLYGFLALYIPGLLFSSNAAILIALFNHAYIWVHYFCTELPDIKYIYKNN